MAGAWVESVAEAHRRAKKRLPDSVYMATSIRALPAIADAVGAETEVLLDGGSAPRIGWCPTPSSAASALPVSS
jgi:hypothetical protein